MHRCQHVLGISVRDLVPLIGAEFRIEILDEGVMAGKAIRKYERFRRRSAIVGQETKSHVVFSHPCPSFRQTRSR